ncbi:hybrid sensor histidine kinase/response regulator transcription factor [Spirosoma utsteinense]|uniref:histidine kinase n=1 Tax=Spirosoma utsteinense TaxID=2585773 RepID=A0ABR6W842_9BACT|nr:ATP-binding protein [Spirosoma utsteinense]MBC3792735.1 signal transduction histidine kinase/DNA-binding response OmpR family regulator [Spirosoma utsteinense]
MKLLCRVFLLMLLFTSSSRADPIPDSVLLVTHLPATGLLLDKGWRYQAGDKPDWATPEYNDRNWQPINPTQDIYQLQPIWNTPIGWFRLHLSVTDSLSRQALALQIEQTGASEIYLNGRLLLRLGKLSPRPERVQAQTLPNQLLPLPLAGGRDQVIAVRFALQQHIPYIQILGRGNPGLRLKMQEVQAAVQAIEANDSKGVESFRAGVFFMLAILHLAFFWFYPAQRANLYFFIYSFLVALSTLAGIQAQQAYLVEAKMYLLILRLTTGILPNTYFFLLALYSLFGFRRGLIFWLLSAGMLVLYLFKLSYQDDYLKNFLFVLAVSLESIRLALRAMKKKQRGATLILWGATSFLVFFCLFRLLIYGYIPAPLSYQDWLFNVSFISLPIAVSLVLAQDFAFVNRSLGTKQREVEQLGEKMRRQQQEKQQLAEINELQSRFVANISHEFRTPLSLIRGTTEKLRQREGTVGERQTDYQRIDQSAGQVLGMVNQLLDLSRLEAGKLTIHPEPAELSSFLRRLAGSFVSLFESKGIIYEYSAPLQSLWVAVDSARLEQILSNLLSNAAKFTPGGRAVRFAARFELLSAEQMSLQLVVEDTGIGIAPADQDRIFDRFYQADTSTTRSYEGSGLGLAIVKELVELHGGSIHVESTMGNGTTFTIQVPLPLVTAPETVSATETASITEPLPTNRSSQWQAPQHPVTTSKGTPRKTPATSQVLVVEDHAGLRQFIREALEMQYTVEEAANGQEGYRLALKHLPDLIISDVMMPGLDGPGLDGLMLCEKLKSDPRTSHIPIILLTAKAGTESRLQGLKNGADEYLTKPFSLEELHLRVNNIVESRRKLRDKYARQVTLHPSGIAVTSTDEQFLQRALATVEAQLANPTFDVADLSRGVGMSRSNLHRKLTALTGLSANVFIRSVRLKRAAYLLERGYGNVGEVATQVGFNSLNYFARCFREEYGKTPSEYSRPQTVINPEPLHP